MSNAIVIDAHAFSFVPSSGGVAELESDMSGISAQDRVSVEREVRAELEAEFEQRVEQQVVQRLEAERKLFDVSLRRTVNGFDELVKTMRKDIQNKVVDLALQLSEVIVRHELPDRDMLRNLVVKTLEPISDLQGAMVRISSSDWALFGEEISSGDPLGVGSTVKFAEDPNLTEGDVIVESRNGIFDARLSERLKLLKESLHERSGRKAPESSEL